MIGCHAHVGHAAGFGLVPRLFVNDYNLRHVVTMVARAPRKRSGIPSAPITSFFAKRSKTDESGKRG